MPWMALAPGHQRRVQRRGDLGDHLDADERAEDEDGQPDDRLAHCSAPPSRAARVGSCRTVPSCVTHAAGHDLVVEVGGEGGPVVGGHRHQRDQVDDVLRVEPGRRAGHLAGHVGPAPHLRVADPDHLPGHRPLDVAAALRGEVDHDGAGPHLLDHVVGDQHRRRPAGHRGGGDQRVRGGDVRREQLALTLGPVLGHLAGVAAGALERLQLQLDGDRRPSTGSPRRPRHARRRPSPPHRAAWPSRWPGDRRRRRRAPRPARAAPCRRPSCSAGRSGAAARPRRSRSGSRPRAPARTARPSTAPG